MARLNVNEDVRENQTENLDELIPVYGEKNDTAKELKKTLSELGTKIKSLMKNGTDKYVAGNYTAKYVEKKSESFDEDAFLIKLGTVNCPSYLRREAETLGIIKTKEYIDMDVLESALYHNRVSESFKEELEACTIVKEIPTLTVTKLKEKK